MLYLSKLSFEPFIGTGQPSNTTNLPTHYIGRLYIDSNTGITYRLVQDSNNNNVWEVINEGTVKTDVNDVAGFLNSKLDPDYFRIVSHKLTINENNIAKKDLSNVDSNIILDKLLPVDGVGSGLDADLLTGKSLEQLEGRVMSKAEFEALAEIRRKQYAGSGFIEWGGTQDVKIRDYYGSGINDGNWRRVNLGIQTRVINESFYIYDLNFRDAFFMGSLHRNAYNPSKPIVNVNGILLKLYDGIATAANAINLVKLPHPPTSLATITDSSNLSVDMKQGDFAILKDLDRELVENGTFDNGIDGWRQDPNGVLNIEYDGANKRLKITRNNSTDNRDVYYLFNAIKNVMHEATVGNFDSSKYEVIIAENGSYIANLQPNSTTRLKFSTSNYRIIIRAKPDTTGTYYFDNISIKQLEPAPIVALQNVSVGTDIYQNTDKFEGRDSVSRQDLVFLESWHEDISEKDVVYPYGNVQYRGGNVDGLSGISDATWFNGYDTYSRFGVWQEPGELVGKGYRWSQLSETDKIKLASNPDNNIYKDGDKWMQVRYRTRIVKGLGNNWENVDPLQNKMFSYNSTYGRYGRVTVKADKIEPYYGYDLYGSDYNTYRITSRNRPDSGYLGTFMEQYGNNKTANALQIVLVQRRNGGIYHKVYNPEGCALAAYDDGNGLDIKEWWQLPDGFITSLKDCFDPIKIATYNPDTGSVGTLSSPQNGYYTTGTIASRKSGRPDGLYADEINERDVEDLRMSAQRKSFNEMRNKWRTKSIAGEVRGKELGIRFVVIANTLDSGISNIIWWLSAIFKYNNENSDIIGLPVFLLDENKNIKSFAQIQRHRLSESYPASLFLDRNINRSEYSYYMLPVKDKSYTYNNTLTVTNIIGDPRRLKNRITYDTSSTNSGNVPKNTYIKHSNGHYYRALSDRGNLSNIEDDIANNSSEWIDLGTDGNIGGYPDEWIEKGIEGTPLIVGEEGDSLLPIDKGIYSTGCLNSIKLTMKNLSSYKVLKLLVSTKDGKFTEFTYGNHNDKFKYSYNNVGNTIYINIVNSYGDLGYTTEHEMLDLMKVIVVYETKANFLELANNTTFLSIDDTADVLGKNYITGGGNALQQNLINKIGIGGYTSVWRTSLTQRGWKINWLDSYNGSYDYLPHHLPFNLNQERTPRVKYFTYLTVENNRAYLQYVFKELKYDTDSGSWGDDNKFQITDKVSTITDLNGNNVLYGQKRFALPYFITDED